MEDVRFSSDAVHGVDVLGIQPEVDVLVRLITSESCQPPLTIGIFGDWGAGKTFFMHAMMRSVAARAASGVVQLEFNAWHYIDTNTMASLVHRVFEAIQRTAGQRGEAVFGKLQLGNELLENAKRAMEESIAQRDALARDVASLNERVEQLQVPADTFASPAVQEALAVHQIKDVVAQLTRGVDHPSVDLLRQILSTTSGLFSAIRLAWLDAPVGVLGGGVVGALVGWGGAAVFYPTLTKQYGPIFLVATSAAYALGVAFAASLWLATRVRRRLARFVENYQIDAQRVELAMQQRREASAAKQRAEAMLEEARIRVEEARKQVQPTSKSLAEFIDDRIRTSAGDAVLGLVTKIRSDFERLSALLLDARDIPLSRIIVYIDDLDRCPPEKVVEVLSATHVLLGFPLFVVVLAADARWISRSLQKHFPDLLRVVGSADGTASVGGANASSIDYLEKIVHLPLWLKPLDETRCRHLIDSLLAPEELTEDERVSMSTLAPLLGRSPRTVTRFVNIYRLLRARSATAPFPHKPTILLLGLVSGQPELAAYVLERLRKADRTMTIKQLANALHADATGQMKAEWLAQLWSQSGDALRKLLDDLGPDTPIAELQGIGREAQRYSFLKP